MGSSLIRKLLYNNSSLVPNLKAHLDYTSLFKYKRKGLKQNRANLYFYAQFSRRSTRITLVDKMGKILLTMSAGMNYKKSNRKGPFPATRLILLFMERLQKLNLKGRRIVFCLKGFGPGRRPIITYIKHNILNKKQKYCYLVDLTSIPFNGCRLKKSRRL